MYEYKAVIVRVIDGDTVDVDVDLGFGIWMKKERVRLYGIDTPESRTRDKVEKVFGLASKKRLKELLGKKCILKTFAARDGEDMKGKFGRILGDFNVYNAEEDRWCAVSEILVAESHAVAYHGQSKDNIQEAHLVNRDKLVSSGLIKLK
tara:strand:+ start:3341 stop:3787 length:447 start_codon:yes stop_codon:yes gene_type:complete